jgi:hypothetical protein
MYNQHMLTKFVLWVAQLGHQKLLEVLPSTFALSGGRPFGPSRVPRETLTAACVAADTPTLSEAVGVWAAVGDAVGVAVGVVVGVGLGVAVGAAVGVGVRAAVGVVVGVGVGVAVGAAVGVGVRAAVGVVVGWRGIVRRWWIAWGPWTAISSIAPSVTSISTRVPSLR